MAYNISENDRILVGSVKAFCEAEVKEQIKPYDVSGEWPYEIYEKANAQGFNEFFIPEELGGPGLDPVVCAAMLEEIAAVDAAMGITYMTSGLSFHAVMDHATREITLDAVRLMKQGKQGAFALTDAGAGSDAMNGNVDAERAEGGFVINGVKTMITNALTAGYFVVFANTDKNDRKRKMTAFYVPADSPGVILSRKEDKLGIRTSDTRDVIFDHVFVPEKNIIGKIGDGFKIAMKSLDVGRIWMAATAIGTARSAMEEAAKYSLAREQFGKPIAANQAIQFKLADMWIKIEGARQLTQQAIHLLKKGEKHTMISASAKCAASDAAVFCATEAVQILAGYGYSREYPVEKLYRDAKIYQIGEGTNEIQRMVIARGILGRRFDEDRFDGADKAGKAALVIREDDPAAAAGKLVKAMELFGVSFGSAGKAAPNLESAAVVLAGGSGLQDADGFAALRNLAAKLGAAVGATTPVVSYGWADESEIIGQSGKTVAPELYVSFGISGQTPHTAGMSGSKHVIAVTKDENAPIMRFADIAVIGDAKGIIEAILSDMQ